MNERYRQQLKVAKQKGKVMFLAIIHHEKYAEIKLIHPDDWDDMKKKYGDNIEKW